MEGRNGQHRVGAPHQMSRTCCRTLYFTIKGLAIRISKVVRSCLRTARDGLGTERVGSEVTTCYLDRRQGPSDSQATSELT